MSLTVGIIGLLCLSSGNAMPTEEKPTQVLKGNRHVFNKYEIIFDEQPIKDNTLLYSACEVDRFRKGINCTVVLKLFLDVKTTTTLTCQSDHKADVARQITNQFQLKKLFGNTVAFVWADEEKLQSDVPKRHLVLTVIDMTDCKSQNYEFKTHVEDFYIVSYDDTFDVYYPDKRRCGNYLCGETFDSRMKVLNGPTASYLPSQYFDEDSRMCSVQSNSSSKGFYLITPNDFHLVTSSYGKEMIMTAYPLDGSTSTYACNKDYLGFCWLSTLNRRQINCNQFNPRGKQVLLTGLSLKYPVGTWMAMQNLDDSELLLLVNQCNNLDECVENTQNVEFHVLRVKPDGKTEDLHQFRGLECRNVRDIKSEVVKKENGDICVTLACHVRNEEDQESSINFLFTCFLK